MQSEMADFALGVATWRTERNMRAVYSSLLATLCEKWRHPQNRKYITYCIAVKVGPKARPWVTCTENGEMWTCDFWNMRTQTEKQTDKRDRYSLTYRRRAGSSATAELLVEICEWTDRQTNRHTDSLITVLRIRNGGEVVNSMMKYKT